MVRGVGVMLCFQAEGVAALVHVAVLAGYCAIKKVPGVELDCGLCGGDFQDAAAGGVIGARG